MRMAHLIVRDVPPAMELLMSTQKIINFLDRKSHFYTIGHLAKSHFTRCNPYWNQWIQGFRIIYHRSREYDDGTYGVVLQNDNESIGGALQLPIQHIHLHTLYRLKVLSPKSLEEIINSQ